MKSTILIPILTITAAVAISAKAQSCVPPPPGIVAWWPGDGDANDIIGTNSGTVYGNVFYTNGLVGEAYDFDGTGGYVQCPPATRGLTNGTVEFWFNLNSWNWRSAQNGLHFWAGTEYAPNSPSPFDGLNLGAHPDVPTGELLFGNWDDPNFVWHWARSGLVPQTNTWYRVAGTWGQAGVCVYTNGVLAGTNAYTAPPPSYIAYNLIGRSSWPGTSINGRVDEVSIYNRALSALEVAEIYAAGSAGKCRAPVVSLIKAVKPSFSNLILTTNYQLQVSSDLINWTNQGAAFTATNANTVYPQYWDVDNWGQLYFRLQVAP